jgi:hypothetical protein
MSNPMVDQIRSGPVSLDQILLRPSTARAPTRTSAQRLTVIGILLAMFQHITGINTVIYDAPTLLNARTLLKGAGFSGLHRQDPGCPLGTALTGPAD